MESDDTSPIRVQLQTLVDEAKASLEQAEAVADTIPRLRRDIKALERSLAAMDGADTPRTVRRGGPTIRERILAVIEGNGGRIDFEPGRMLHTIHDEVGGNKNSVQVEIHRLEKGTNQIEVVRDDRGKPIALVLKPVKLTAVPAADLREG